MLKNEKLCPVCHSEPAQIHPVFKVLPGLKCQNLRDQNSLPDKQMEFTSQDIKDQRKEYAGSIIQPYRSGQLSREYLEMYGTKGIRPSQAEIKSAKRVWTEDFSYNFDLKKTK